MAIVYYVWIPPLWMGPVEAGAPALGQCGARIVTVDPAVATALGAAVVVGLLPDAAVVGEVDPPVQHAVIRTARPARRLPPIARLSALMAVPSPRRQTAGPRSTAQSAVPVLPRGNARYVLILRRRCSRPVAGSWLQAWTPQRDQHQGAGATADAHGAAQSSRRRTATDSRAPRWSPTEPSPAPIVFTVT